MYMEFQEVKRITLTMREAADYLGISYWLINQLVKNTKQELIEQIAVNDSRDEICIAVNCFRN